jgi:hypothetical protein
MTNFYQVTRGTTLKNDLFERKVFWAKLYNQMWQSSYKLLPFSQYCKNKQIDLYLVILRKNKTCNSSKNEHILCDKKKL